MRKFNITVNGTAYEVELEEVAGNASAAVAPTVAAPAPKAVPAPAAAAPAVKPQVAEAGGDPVKSPMPGTIVNIKVAQGAAVKKGQVLLILEAMKMENEILSPKDGTVAQIAVAQGATVSSGDLLAVIG